MSKVKLGDIAFERKESIKSAGRPSMPLVGLEHLIPESLALPAWDDSANSDFTKAFYRGDILFGRRRAYQKKAAFAPVDGICSGDITVITAKPDVILPELLPFIIQNDTFFDYAVKGSAGSLSPRVKWEYLKNFEFSLSSLDEQRRLAKLLWKIDSLEHKYRRLIDQCDELIKAQFVEMFEKYSHQTVPVSQVMRNMRNGISPSKNGSHYAKVLTLSAITQGCFDSSAWKDGFFEEYPAEEKRITPDDFYICRGNGNKSLVGAGVYSSTYYEDLVFPDTVIAAKVDTKQISMPYLFVAWQMPNIRKQIEQAASTTNGTYKINQNAISNINLILPPIRLQNDFAAFVQQINASKESLKTTLSSLQAVKKSILQSVFA